MIMAATIVGQGKIAELTDFLRFGVVYVEDPYSQQPVQNSAGAWNCVSHLSEKSSVFRTRKAITPGATYLLQLIHHIFSG
ncbi:hypothetical protein D9757_010481 [Collybiopsis confluens]|uniref:Uncharacterized protein n=1 Tax=Collybiopsis confluens TaxID=2823264 RepID=A0A8H5LY01_9AGAR|nr:hypothetical protein D9757_010481 [Collybiopsis confluens]